MNPYKNLIFFLPHFIKGGASFAILNLCSFLHKKKFNIHVICIGKCSLKKDLKKIKVKVYEIKKKRTFLAVSQIRLITKKILCLNKSKTIFISNHHYANVISIIALLGLNIKKILVERTSIDQLKIFYSIKDFFKKIIILFLVKRFYKKSDLIIANSKNEANNIRNFTKSKTIHIYPASYKNIKFKPIKKIKGKINILSVGSLTKEKGYDTIIKAIGVLRNKNIVLNLLGQGFDKTQNIKSDLKLLILKLNLSNQIKLNGYKKNTKPFYLNSSIYVNSSHLEGFSSSTIDAMNYGIPVICSDGSGGNKEIVNNGKAGFLFKKRDYIDLASKIRLVIKEKNKTLIKKRNAETHIKKFSYLNNFLNYEKIKNEI